MKLHRLNEAGIEAFASYLTLLKEQPSMHVPTHLLDSHAYAEPLNTTVAVEAKEFGTRLAAAEYLHAKLQASGLKAVDTDCGLWTWLALYYFDQLCPADNRGIRKLGERARYIAELNNYKRYYRHLLAGPYFIYNAHVDEPTRASAILVGRLNSPGDVVEQIASRHELVTNRSIMSVLTKLYVHEDGSIKKGAGGKANGAARRFADVLGQFELTFDLYSISADYLMGLLPTIEFNRFQR